LDQLAQVLDTIQGAFYQDLPVITQGMNSLRSKLFSPKVAQLGFDYPTKEDHLISFKRTLVIKAATKAGDKS
jgi:hypothetical protein